MAEAHTCCGDPGGCPLDVAGRRARSDAPQVSGGDPDMAYKDNRRFYAVLHLV